MAKSRKGRGGKKPTAAEKRAAAEAERKRLAANERRRLARQIARDAAAEARRQEQIRAAKAERKRLEANARRREARRLAAMEAERLRQVALEREAARRETINARRRAARAAAAAERKAKEKKAAAREERKNTKKAALRKLAAEEKQKEEEEAKRLSGIEFQPLPPGNKLREKLVEYPPEFKVELPDSEEAKDLVEYRLTELEKWLHAPAFTDECRTKRPPSTEVTVFRYRDMYVDGELAISDIPYPKLAQDRMDLLTCIFNYLGDKIEPIDLAWIQIVCKVSAPEGVESGDARFSGSTYYATSWQMLLVKQALSPPFVGYRYPIANVIESAKQTLINIRKHRRPFPHTILIRINWNPQGVRPDRGPEK